MEYLVNNIYTCIQGEGCKTGIPMVMLRLQGCEVGCPWCDTKETWKLGQENKKGNIEVVLGQNPFFVSVTEEQVTRYISINCPGPQWVLVSGGEPAQYNLEPLVRSLHQAGYQVAIETSGTETGHIEAGFDWVCVSPKIDMPGGKQVLVQALAVADEVKYVIGKPKDIQILDNLLQSVSLKPSCQILLQPVSQSIPATRLCIDTVTRRGWRLSLQVHKYLDIP